MMCEESQYVMPANPIQVTAIPMRRGIRRNNTRVKLDARITAKAERPNARGSESGPIRAKKRLTPTARVITYVAPVKNENKNRSTVRLRASLFNPIPHEILVTAS